MDNDEQKEYIEYLYDIIDFGNTYLISAEFRITIVQLYIDSGDSFATDPFTGEKNTEKTRQKLLEYITRVEEVTPESTKPIGLFEIDFYTNYKSELKLISNAIQVLYGKSVKLLEEIDEIKKDEELTKSILSSISSTATNSKIILLELLKHYNHIGIYLDNYKELPYTYNRSINEIVSISGLRNEKKQYTNKEIAYVLDKVFGSVIHKMSKAQKQLVLGIITSRGSNDIYQNLSGSSLPELSKKELDLLLNPIIDKINSSK